MRFKIDENLPPEAVNPLRDAGHDVLSVWDQRLRGRPDTDLAELCQVEARALVTLDLGFADIREYPPEAFAGLVVLRLRIQSRFRVLAVLKRLIPVLVREPLAGRLWIVSEHDIRVRGGSAEPKDHA